VGRCSSIAQASRLERTRIVLMERSGIRENFLYDLKRRPAGGRKRPSSAAENQAAGTCIDTSLACIGLALRAPRLGNLHQDADRPIPLTGRNSARPARRRGAAKSSRGQLHSATVDWMSFLRLFPRRRPLRALQITRSPPVGASPFGHRPASGLRKHVVRRFLYVPRRRVTGLCRVHRARRCAVGQGSARGTRRAA
jgi:hypothetical protein